MVPLKLIGAMCWPPAPPHLAPRAQRVNQGSCLTLASDDIALVFLAYQTLLDISNKLTYVGDGGEGVVGGGRISL